MRLSARSEFDFTTDLDAEALKAAVVAALGQFSAEHGEIVLSTEVTTPTDGEIQVTVVLRTSSFATAESAMDDAAEVVRTHIRQLHAAQEIHRGSTELVPA
jgi:hypothetical protein